jgi:DNA-binding IclR family transcriptional regulator
MTQTLPQALRLPIYDLASGKAWLDALNDAGLMFHLEDDPADMIEIETNEPTFFEDDLELLRERVGDLYDLDWGDLDCPIGYCLTLTE